MPLSRRTSGKADRKEDGTWNEKKAIRSAYWLTGGNNFYDGMITCSTLSGKAVCCSGWDMNKAENDAYLEKALSGMVIFFFVNKIIFPEGEANKAN